MSQAAAIPDVSEEFAKRAREEYRLLKIGLLAILVLACAIPFAINVVDADLWGHVRYGEEALAAGHLPQTATHTFTAIGYPWVNHENGFELGVAWANQHWGIYPLLVFKCLLGVAILASMVWVAKRHSVPAISTWVLLAIVSSNLQASFPLRPQILSFGFFAIMAICLDRAFADWAEGRRVRWAWLWPLPPLYAAWVNCHGGFVAGLAILGVYLFGRMVELVTSRATLEAQRPESNIPRPATGIRQKLPTLLALSAVGLASVAATLLNPYGFGLLRWLAYSLWTPQPEITEWLPANNDNPVFWPFVALSVTALASLTLTRRRRDWTHIVIIALIWGQACLHMRHIAFFALTCGFWLPEHWHSAWVRLKPERGKLPIVRPALWIRLSMAAGILVAIVCQSIALSDRLADFPVYRSTWPVDAVQFMVDHHMGGKLVCCFNWAQYALAALGDDVQLSFDGRFDTCYPDEVIDMNFDFLLGDAHGLRFRNPASGQLDRTRVLRYGHPDLVLVDHRYKDPVQVMAAEAARDNPEWTLLYRDPIADLWGRRERYDDLASPDYLPPSQRPLHVNLLQARWQWPAYPDWSLWDELDKARQQALEAAKDAGAATPSIVAASK